MGRTGGAKLAVIELSCFARLATSYLSGIKDEILTTFVGFHSLGSLTGRDWVEVLVWDGHCSCLKLNFPLLGRRGEEDGNGPTGRVPLSM